MSKGREISDYLDDIVTSIADVEEFTNGMSYEMFAADKKTVNDKEQSVIPRPDWMITLMAPATPPTVCRQRTSN